MPPSSSIYPLNMGRRPSLCWKTWCLKVRVALNLLILSLWVRLRMVWPIKPRFNSKLASSFRWFWGSMGIYLWSKSSFRLSGFPHSESVPAAHVLTSPPRSSTSRSWSRYEVVVFNKLLSSIGLDHFVLKGIWNLVLWQYVWLLCWSLMIHCLQYSKIQ